MRSTPPACVWRAPPKTPRADELWTTPGERVRGRRGPPHGPPIPPTPLEALLGRLDLLPPPIDLGRIGGGLVTEDVGIAADHLVAEASRHVVDVELAGLGCDGGVQVDLEQHVAQLVADAGGVAGLDRLDDL